MKAKPYLLFRSHEQANIRFYEGYDPSFLFRKADLIYFAYSRRDEFLTFLNSANCSTEGFNDAYFHGIAAELHCSSFQQFESLFALMLAAFQPLPHWIYLTRYTTREIKTKVEAFVTGDIVGATQGVCKSADDFIQNSVYPGVSEPHDQSGSWRTSIADLRWTLERLAAEYNAYKHGLRVLPGSAQLLVDISAGANNFHPVLSMQHALSFLEISAKGDGYGVQEVTKEINAEYAYQNLYAMSTIAETIKNLRLAGLKHERVEVPTFTVDKNGICRLRPVGKFAFPL